MPVNATNSPWTQARADQLAALWADGASIRKAAKALRTSPGSISSKLSRLGLLGTRTPTVPPTPKKERRQKRRVGPVRSLKHTRKPVPETPQMQPSLNVPLTELRFDQCRAVTDSTRWEQRYCGHPRDRDAAYCAGHRALFYTRSSGRVK